MNARYNVFSDVGVQREIILSVTSRQRSLRAQFSSDQFGINTIRSTDVFAFHTYRRQYDQSCTLAGRHVKLLWNFACLRYFET